MPEPVPVLLISRELDGGGTERQLTLIARSLDRSRFAPHVACFRASGLRLDEVRAAGIPVVEFPVRSLAAPIPGAIAMGRYLRQQAIRIVHTFDVPANLFGVPAARWFRAPVVISSQRASRDLTPGVYRRLLRITDDLADAIVVNSEAVRREMVHVDRVPPSRIHLCRNGIDTDLFPPVPHDGQTIGTVAVLRPEKGLLTLVEAAGDRDVLVVGDGPMRAELERRAGPRWQFAGAAANVAPWLRRIDIFVLPSLSEAFSNALMEAMASGCAVVASRVGGNPELVRHGENGLLFEPGDAAGLRQELLLLESNPALRRRLGAAAAATIREKFSLHAAVRRIEALYESLLRSEQLR